MPSSPSLRLRVSLIAAVVALAVLWLVLCLLSRPAETLPQVAIDGAALQSDEAPSGEGESASITPAMERSPVVVDGCYTLLVRDEAGAELEGVVAGKLLRPWLSLRPDVEPIPARAFLARSDSRGVIEIDGVAVPKDGRVVVCAAGFEPELLTGAAPDRRDELVLRRSFELHLRVVSDDGRPVSGYRVRIARAAPESGDGSAGDGSHMVMRDRGAGGAVFVGTSDDRGSIVVRGLARGRYFLSRNRDMLPYSSFGVPIVVDVPGPPTTITLTEYWGAALRFEGDEVVAVSRTNLERKALFRTPSSRLEKAVVDKWTSALEERFPGATILFGKPRRSIAASGCGRLLVFGRRGGWSTHDVVLTRMSDLASEQVMRLPGGAADQTGVLSVVATDEHDEVIDLPAAGVVVEYRHDKDFLVGVRMALGVAQQVPAGTCKVLTGGRLCRDAFAPMSVTVGPTERRDLRIPMGDVRGYRVSMQLRHGRLARQWGLMLDTPGQPLYPCNDERYLLFSTSPSLSFRAFAQGYVEASGVLEHLSLAKGGVRVQNFQIDMGELRAVR